MFLPSPCPVMDLPVYGEADGANFITIED